VETRDAVWGIGHMAGWLPRALTDVIAGCQTWLKSFKSLRRKYAEQVNACVAAWNVSIKGILTVERGVSGPVGEDGNCMDKMFSQPPFRYTPSSAFDGQRALPWSLASWADRELRPTVVPRLVDTHIHPRVHWYC